MWRDSDAVYQVTAEPGVLTLIQWPPLYCFGSRLPLLLGAWREGMPYSWDLPTLTDTGVGLLISLQHLGLWVAAAALIGTATPSPARRWIAAAIFAIFPVFYLYAHTVGTESLSNCFLFGIASVSLVILRRERPTLSLWVTLFILLFLAILTRHINAVVAGLLPGALILLTLFRLPHLLREKDRGSIRRPLVSLAIAIAIGLASILAAKITVRILCDLEDTPYRARSGYTMQRRLGFLHGISPAQQDIFFADVSRGLSDPVLIEAWAAYRANLASTRKEPDFISDFLKDRIDAGPKMSERVRGAIVDAQLNTWGRAILRSGSAPYRDAVIFDCLQLYTFTLSDFTQDPFNSTSWLSLRLEDEDFSVLKPLTSFGTIFARQADNIWDQNPWFLAGASLPIGALIGFVVLLWAAVLILRRGIAPAHALALVGSLLVTTNFIFVLNSLFTNAKPRFALPLLAAIIIAVIYAVAEIRRSPRRLPDSPPSP